MDLLREFFYWSVSIAAILFGLFILASLMFILYLKNLTTRVSQKIDWQVSEAARRFRTMTVTSTIIRILKLIF